MSRCFPFPPPGYEKKEISVQDDLLAKEKHWEKKHKKEKKDKKEKREGKEKAEKDRSRDKHKEKKDKKEKKREKDKARTSADELDKQKESHNGGNLGDNGWKTDEINCSKFTVELAKRIDDGEKVAATRMVESFNVAAQRSTNGLGAATVLLMERVASSHEILSSVGVSQRTADTSREPINLPSTSQKVGSIASANLLQKETSGQLGQALKARRGDGASTLPVGKTEVFVRGGSEGSSLASGIEVAKYKFNKVASFHASTTQKTINGMAKTANSPSNLGQKAVNAIGFSTKMEDRRVSTVDSEAQSGKKRHGDKIGDQKKKDKEKNKKKEKEKAKTSGEGEHKHKKPGDSKYGRKSDEIVNLQVKPSTLQTVNSTYHTGEKIKKRKEIEINGYRHESDIRPNKIQRTTPPHHHAENGRKLLSGVKPDCSAMEPELLKSNAEGQTNVDNKCMGNVIVEAGLRHPVSISTNTFSEVSLKPPRPDAKHLNREVSLKPPHPDAKYLGRIHYVPQMDEWPDYESQEWLFSGSKVLQKQRNMLEADETPEVWAEALRIEACDLLALPYVIPL